jgi:hypothetical protein
VAFWPAVRTRGVIIGGVVACSRVRDSEKAALWRLLLLL